MYGRFEIKLQMQVRTCILSLFLSPVHNGRNHCLFIYGGDTIVESSRGIQTENKVLCLHSAEYGRCRTGRIWYLSIDVISLKIDLITQFMNSSYL